MRGVVFSGYRKIEIASFDDPAPGPGEVVVEIKASGMCGTDLKSNWPTSSSISRSMARQ